MIAFVNFYLQRAHPASSESSEGAQSEEEKKKKKKKKEKKHKKSKSGDASSEVCLNSIRHKRVALHTTMYYQWVSLL